ncbi:MAG: NnrS family protein [Burkholderiales bacterium]|nr:NnrS family protein [Burkholderiales bacterium]
MISEPLPEGVSALVDPWHLASSLWLAAQAALLAVVAILCLRLALRFRRQPALRQPLVAMFYIAFVWWDVSLWLGAASRWPGLSAGATAALETARLHTLALGFLGGTLLAMAIRVSAAHSGRPRPIDTPARWLYRALQATLVCRLVPLLWAQSGWLLLPLAACAWAGIAVIWALRHGRWAGCPRVDGRPA